MENRYKIVRYDLYCEDCKHKNEPDYEDVCNECLNNPGNQNSQKPINFEKKENDEKGK